MTTWKWRALLLASLSACGTRARSGADVSSHAPKAFDDSLVANVHGSGCVEERRKLEEHDVVGADKTVAALKGEHSRSWPAILTWENGSSLSGTTELTLSFADVSEANRVTPRRQQGGSDETPCEAYVELRGALRMTTRDGRWNVTLPASLRVADVGDTVITLTQPVAVLPFPTWAADVRASDSASLFTELVPSAATGELVVHAADGTRRTAASWK